jgi:NADPH-dependent ferric siderophore reductase
MARVTLVGEELRDFEVPEPAASLRLLVPSPGSGKLVMPVWNGNEFRLPGGERPIIRTFTPRRFDPAAKELDIDIVLHPGGAASAWVEAAEPGDQVAVSGPGRGYQIDPEATSSLLAGDETALPAIGQLLEVIEASLPVRVIIEVSHSDARIELPEHPGATVDWVERSGPVVPGSALVAAITATVIDPGTKAWVAGEAGSLVPIRRHLFDELGLNRSDVAVRGYWKYGR